VSYINVGSSRADELSFGVAALEAEDVCEIGCSMSQRIRNGVFVGLVVVTLIAVGVLVWPTPKEAMAANWPVKLTLEWFAIGDPWQRDVNVTAQLYTAGMNPIGVPVELIPADNNQTWTGFLPDGGHNPWYVRFYWDYDSDGQDEGYIWDNEARPPLVVPANTSLSEGVSEYTEIEP